MTIVNLLGYERGCHLLDLLVAIQHLGGCFQLTDNRTVLGPGRNNHFKATITCI